MTAAATPPSLKWTKDDVNEWSADLPRGGFVTIGRARPSRWHANGVSGLVEDREAAWMWSVAFRREGGANVVDRQAVADGSTVREAKRIAERLVA